MKLTSAFAVLPFALVASARQQANYVGCFTSSGSLENQGSSTFQTVGYCVNVCNGRDFKYAAVQKNNCFCGNTVPDHADMTDDDECSSACPGFANDNCGGRDAWSVYFGRNGSKPDWLSSSSSAVTGTSTESTSTTSILTSASTSTSSEPSNSSSGSLTSSANVSKNSSASASTSSMEPTSTPNSASRRLSFMF